ncbi:MAG: efflux RND transporter periplasmic adaptor subunit [Pirellulaceae bacterium]|nr:efflux RND transporter periplasmic adaptor subunit [Pirellulaceae bacterium]
MSTDVLPETQSHPQPPRGQQRGDRQDSPQGRWWKRGLVAIGVVAVLAPAAALIPGDRSSRDLGPVLTHTITRGDLIVTVTEQGTLESSDNTEIKNKVRGDSTVIWVVESGTEVEPGDELVRLDTLALEDAIAERTKYAHLTRSGAERARATWESAKLAIPEYLEGTYRTQLMELEKSLVIAESGLVTAQNMLDHDKMMAERGYTSELQVQQKTFAVMRASLNVKARKTEIGVLKDYTKRMDMATLTGNLKAAEARLAAEEERSKQDAERRDLAKQELEYCVVKAERSGLVIHPSAAEWKGAPEIEEGATVHMDQVMLLMPDLSKMQVKVGIHESIVDRIRPGLAAKITLPDETLDGEVTSVAPITRPAGWWTGNVVKYDTIVKLPSAERLKPGMSAEVEVIMARHEDVLTIPVAAVVETAEGGFCWIKTADGAQRRSLGLGDSDDQFIVVKTGLEEGEEVVLDPLASIEEAQTLVLEPLEKTMQEK